MTLPLSFPDVPFDSWLTIGDNHEPVTPVAPIGDLNWPSFAGSSWNTGGTINSDASIFRLPTDAECLPDANNKILLGQFTTSGVLSGYINLAGLDAAGNGWDESNIPIPQIQVSGCTDLTACNYDASANVDDGSCDLPNGCGDALYLEYDPLVTCSDASACITLIVNGCTDPTASNYCATCNFDDGSCTYPGCMDSLATNYNPIANVNDTSCVYSCAYYGQVDVNITVTTNPWPSEVGWSLTNDATGLYVWTMAVIQCRCSIPLVMVGMVLLIQLQILIAIQYILLELYLLEHMAFLNSVLMLVLLLL